MVHDYSKAYNLPTGPPTCELVTKRGGTAVFVVPADPLQYKKVIPSVRLCVWDMCFLGSQNPESSWGKTHKGAVRAGTNPLPKQGRQYRPLWVTSPASFGVCESGSTETPADLQLRVGNPLRIGLNKAFCRSFATIIMYLVVSSILNSKKVGAKLLVRGALPISVLFW